MFEYVWMYVYEQICVFVCKCVCFNFSLCSLYDVLTLGNAPRGRRTGVGIIGPKSQVIRGIQLNNRQIAKEQYHVDMWPWKWLFHLTRFYFLNIFVGSLCLFNPQFSVHHQLWLTPTDKEINSFLYCWRYILCSRALWPNWKRMAHYFGWSHYSLLQMP